MRLGGAGGSTGVVAELLRELSVEAVYVLHEMFV